MEQSVGWVVFVWGCPTCGLFVRKSIIQFQVGIGTPRSANSEAQWPDCVEGSAVVQEQNSCIWVWGCMKAESLQPNFSRCILRALLISRKLPCDHKCACLDAAGCGVVCARATALSADLFEQHVNWRGLNWCLRTSFSRHFMAIFWRSQWLNSPRTTIAVMHTREQTDFNTVQWVTLWA